MEDKNSVLKNCISRWEYKDDKSEDFTNNFPEWISQFPDGLLEVVLMMLQSFNYYSHYKVNIIMKNLHGILTSMDSIRNENTIYSYLPSKYGQVGSSIEYMMDYKRINEITKFSFSDDLHSIPYERWAKIDNVVFVDDCCGSGRKFKTFVKDNEEILRGRSVYFLVIEGMASGINNVIHLENELDIQLRVIPHLKSDKFFAKLDLNLDEIDRIKNELNSYSVAKGINPDYTMGFKNAECLMAFYNDTPNGTMGLFWYNTDDYLAPFPREFSPEYAKRPKPSNLSSDKNKRKSQNYAAIKRGRNNE